MPNALYESLKTNKHEVRVVQLSPGSWTAPIICHLETKSLDENPEYDALSYTWGPSDEGRQIILQGVKVDVTDNLFAALRRFRKTDIPITLWIDQLAINQEDLDERSSQVMLMGRVYGQSRKTLLWLGEEPALLDHSSPEDKDNIPRTRPVSWDDIGKEPKLTDLPAIEGIPYTPGDDPIYRAFELVSKLSIWWDVRHVHFDELPCFCEPERSAQTPNTTLYALHYLMTRKWWTRVWTFQEAILPSRAVVCYGPVEFPLLGFVHSGRIFTQLSGTCCAKAVLQMPEIHRTVMNHFVDTVNSIYWPMDYKHRLWKLPLDMILPLTLRREATDPRDKVFGILGLAINWGDDVDKNRIMADYKADKDSVYINALEKLLNIGFSKSSDSEYLTSILSRCRYNPEKISALPSWVVDWSSPLPLTPTMPSVSGLANGGRKGSAPVVTGKNLGLEGVLFDTIAEVSLPMGTTCEVIDAQQFDDILVSWRDLASTATAYTAHETIELGARAKEVAAYYGGIHHSRTWQEAFWRTLCLNSTMGSGTLANGGLSVRRAKAATENVFWVWCRKHHPRMLSRPDFGPEHVTGEDHEVDEIETTSDAHEIHVRSSIKGMRLFVTEKGYLGIGSWTAERGDRICVFLGAAPAYVLRMSNANKAEASDRGGAEAFHLIGECYVDGIMDGQAVEIVNATGIINLV